MTINLPFYCFEVSAAAIFYPITFLITDLINERFGKESARFCIHVSIVMNIVVAIMILILDSLKATPWSKIDDHAFHEIFGFFGAGFIATMVANYVSRMIDLNMYAALRKIMQDKFAWFRSTVTTATSIFIDTCLIWSLLSLLNALPAAKLWTIILNSYGWKIFFTLMSSPLFIISMSATQYLGFISRIKEQNLQSAFLSKHLATE